LEKVDPTRNEVQGAFSHLGMHACMLQVVHACLWTVSACET
jgi:hypothetical protein